VGHPELRLVIKRGGDGRWVHVEIGASSDRRIQGVGQIAVVSVERHDVHAKFVFDILLDLRTQTVLRVLQIDWVNLPDTAVPLETVPVVAEISSEFRLDPGYSFHETVVIRENTAGLNLSKRCVDSVWSVCLSIR